MPEQLKPLALKNRRLVYNLLFQAASQTLLELAADPKVEIVEISVPPQFQLEIARTCIDAGKHLLCQKPLSNDLSQAAEIVWLAEQTGVKLAVNQQLRWGQGIRAGFPPLSEGFVAAGRCRP